MGKQMERKAATELIKASWKQFYPADKGRGSRQGIICPICGSGSGKNGSGITEKPGSKHFLKCWNGGCDFNQGGSVIDLYMMANGIEQFSKAVDEMAGKLGIEIEPYTGNRSTAAEDFAEEPEGEPLPFTGEPAPAAVPAAAAAPAPVADFTEYYRHCVSNLMQSQAAQNYLQQRGISLETALAFGIGFDPQADPAGAPGAMGNAYRAHPCPRIITPTTPAHYVGRSIDPNTEPAFKKLNNKGGKPGLYQEQMLYWGAERVFVTEGVFDALSILEFGKHAIALNSTSNTDLLLAQLEKQPTKSTLVLCLDNDESGKKATEKLKAGLQRLNISYVIADICNGHKDPNDALIADRAAFEAAVTRAANTNKPDNSSLYIDTIMGDDIKRRQQAGKKKTGLANLDAATGGGLRPGLVLFGAISSLGKTTFCSQIADGFAENGSDVIYFSMEQSRLEMVSKSIARQSARIAAQKGMPVESWNQSAVFGAQIADGAIPADKQGIAAQAAEQYKKAVGDRVSIIEAGFNCDTQFLAHYVRTYYTRTGQRPVVIVDYLQVLEPGETGTGRRLDNREKVEESIKQLILLKRELDLTIIAIVSLNRTNYLQPFDFEAIKETGLAEYSGDVVWGLQLACLDESIFSKEGNLKEKREKVKAAKKAIPRKVKLCSVKHRLQNPIYECYFDYYPQFDLFIPAAEPGYTESDLGQKIRKI